MPNRVELWRDTVADDPTARVSPQRHNKAYDRSDPRCGSGTTVGFDAAWHPVEATRAIERLADRASAVQERCAVALGVDVLSGPMGCLRCVSNGGLPSHVQGVEGSGRGAAVVGDREYFGAGVGDVHGVFELC
jgi:hypothetical protein